MAREITVFERSVKADNDLSAKEGYAVVRTATGMDLAGTKGERVLGILQTKPLQGNVGDVRIIGLSKAVVGTGGVTQGDLVTTDNDGTIIRATSGHNVLGQTEDSAVAGEKASVIVYPSGGVIA